jgi:hypothetical protein
VSPESNTRLPQQLCQVAKGSARLEGREAVTDSDILVAQRVAFDTLLPARSAALRAIATGQRLRGADMSRTTAWRALRDLEDLGMIVGQDEVAHVLTDAYRRLWVAAKLDPTIPTR